MAKGASKCLFLLFLSLFTICSSGTLVGFSYHARGTETSSPARTLSFAELNKVTPSHIRIFVADPTVLSTLSGSGVSVDLYLSRSLLGNLLNSKSYVTSWMKRHVMTFLPHINISSIIVTSGSDRSGESELPMLLSTLKSIHSVLSTLHLQTRVRVSVAFSVSFLEKLNRTQERDLHRIFGFVKKIGSYVMVEATIEGELNMGDQFVQSVIERATLASSLLPHNHVPMALTIKSPAVPSATEVAQFGDKVLKSLEKNTQVAEQIVGLYAEVSSLEDFAQNGLKREEELIFPSTHRELLSKSHIKTTLHDTINPPTTVFPTPPISTTPVTNPPDSPTPTIITVPATNPVTTTPTNPAATPLTVPPITPATIPSTNPANPSTPITNPVTTPTTVPGPQPVTNPVTTYPPPTGAVPVTNPTTNPTTNPVAPPATTNAPAIPGQSWCVAKTGASEAALQAALDYACGMGGVDCSQIQQGGNCYNPNTLQNHASYAFNSYFQKNPTATSCDFGSSAAIVNANPSTGSCIYPSSGASSVPSSSLPPPTTATPTLPTTPTPTTASSSGAGVPGSDTPPSVLNTSEPASGITPEFTPPAANDSTSVSSGLQPFIGCIFLVTSFVTGKVVLDM